MSDISLNIKIIKDLYRFYVEKQDVLPLYFGNDISYFLKADIQDNSLQYTKHISKTKLDILARYLFNKKDINLSCLGMLYDGKIVKEYYRYPFTKEYRRVSYSVCKTVIALGIGIAIDKNLLSVDTKLCEIFPEHNRIFMKKAMRQVSVRHLLTMTAGVYFDELSAFFSFDWRKDFMGSDVLFTPGTKFYYNSLNSYMLGACIARVSGQKLIDFLYDNLFEPLKIYDITWDKCPMGLPRGGWGMKLSLRDMLKLGELIKNKGKLISKSGDRQIVSSNYMEQMLLPQIEIKDKAFVNGYGYGIWTLKDGGFLLNGIFGQNVYISIDKNIVIATCGSSNEFFPDGELVERIMLFSKNYDLTRDIFLDFCKNAFIKAYDRMHIYRCTDIGNLKLVKLKKLIGTNLGLTFRFDDYASGILPLVTQIMYSNYFFGIDHIKFDVLEDNFYVTLSDSDIVIRFKIGYSFYQPYEYQIIEVRGKKMPVAVGTTIESDEDNIKFIKLHFVFLEEASDKIFKIYFEKDSVRLKAYETPDLLRFIDKFFDEDRLIRLRKIRKIKSIDYIKYRISKIIRPDIVGYIDE